MTRREFLKAVGWLLGGNGWKDFFGVKAQGEVGIGAAPAARLDVEVQGVGWGVPWGIPWQIGPAEEVEEYGLLFPLWVND